MSLGPPRPASLRRVSLGLMLASSVALGATPGLADPSAVLRLVRSPDHPTMLDDGDAASLAAAAGQSLAWLERQPPDRRFVFGARTLRPAQLARGLRRLLAILADDPTPDALEERVLHEFDVLAAAGRDDGTVLVTGYHEPIVEAAEQSSPAYTVPILTVPDAVARVSLTRAEIEDGRLAGRRVLAWARDPVDVFFMEIEGSGTLLLPDGREMRVGHATTNGRRYRSIGRLLIDEGKLNEETVSMPAIRAWLAANPRERGRVLRHNESFVFFRRLGGPPVGSLGVELTPARSIATDARVFPPASLAFIRTERPVYLADGRVAWRPVSRFVLNQDTGGAIRGAGRVDVFWGRGPDADLSAGVMKQLGTLFFLVPKE